MMHMEPGMPMKARPMQPAEMQQMKTQTGPDMSMP